MKSSSAKRETLNPAKHQPWKPKGEILLGAGLIAVITLLVYLPALNAGFIWDDDDILTENPLIKNWDGLRSIWFSTKFYDYFPLTLTSFWLEWRLWGMNATGYHVTNVLLHALSVVLFWRVLSRLKIPGSWLAALVFAIHPVNVESVAWITERKNTLSLVFFGLALLLYLRFDQTASTAINHRSVSSNRQSAICNLQSPKWYWLSLAAFLCALLSKTSVVMLPFVLLGFAWWQRGKIAPRDVLRTLPFFALSLALSLVTVWVQYHRAIGEDVVHAGNFWARLAGAGWAVWFYLGKTLLPLNLSFVYPRWEVNPASFVSFLPGLALFACLIFSWSFQRTWGRPLLFALGYFVLMLFPVLGFFNIYFQKYSLVADHWQYPAMIGIIALVIGGGAHFYQWRREAERSALLLIAISVVGLLSFGTWRQCRIYKNEETLWRDTLNKNPACWMAHQNLGSILAAQGNLDEAVDHFCTTLQLKPDHPGAHYGLGVAMVIQHRVAEAIPHFQETLRLRPDDVMALNSLAWIYSTERNTNLRNSAEAVRLAGRAVELTHEKDAGILDTLAAAYAEAGQFAAAVKTAQRAIEVASASGQRESAAAMQFRLQLYQAGRVYRQ